MCYFYSLICFFYVSLDLYAQEDIFSLIRKDNVSEIKKAVKNQPNCINQINHNSFTPLILAAYKGNIEIVELLLFEGAKINYQSEMGTALTAAVFKGNIDISKLLLEFKADPNGTDLNGITPLMYAVQFKNKDMIKLLLSFDADKSILDKKGKTAFEYALLSKDEDVIKLLK
jgi:ankyrin repeat protein